MEGRQVISCFQVLEHVHQVSPVRYKNTQKDKYGQGFNPEL